MLNKMIAKTQSYFVKDDGATAIEYGLIAAGISLVILAAVTLLGGSLSGLFEQLAAAMG